jgi:SPP1 gp7 family putative phage head morphogenesis protein
MAESLNVIIADSIVGHQVTLERLKASERRLVLRMLKRLEADLIKELEMNSPTEVVRTAFRQRRLEALLEQTQGTIRGAYQRVRRQVQEDLTGIAQAEVRLSLGDLNGSVSQVLSTAAGFGIQIELASVQLSVEQLREIASDTLIHGAAPSEWWDRQSQRTQRQFADTIRAGMLRGDTTPQLTRAVRELMGMTQRSAETLTRSAVQAVATTVQQRVWEQNEGLIKSLVWQSTLDLKTTPHCIVRDQKRYTVKDKMPIGHSIPWREGPGRIHPRCRSTSRPETRASFDFFEDGIIKTRGRARTPRAEFERRLRELRPDLDDATIAQTIQNARSSMDGAVSVSTSFEDWLRKRSTQEQNTVLGVGKADLWRNGKIGFRDLVNFDGNPVSLAEIQAKL